MNKKKKYVKNYPGNIVISRTESNPLGKKCSLLQNIWSWLQEKKSFKSALPVQIHSPKTQLYPWTDAASHSILLYSHQFTRGINTSSGCPCALVAVLPVFSCCHALCCWCPRARQGGLLQTEHCSAQRDLGGHPAQPCLGFPQGEVMGRDGNVGVLCPWAELGGAQGQVLSLQGWKATGGCALQSVMGTAELHKGGRKGERTKVRRKGKKEIEKSVRHKENGKRKASYMLKSEEQK